VLLFGDGEMSWFALIDTQTGKETEIGGFPVVSPDGARFAVDPDDWDICTGTRRFGVWRLTRHLPVREWSAEQLACVDLKPWEVGQLEWRSRDTLAFTRLVHPADSLRRERREIDSVHSTLVRSGFSWILDASTRAAVARSSP
jgi:hypothetical protein